jgi:hypothetical protein
MEIKPGFYQHYTGRVYLVIGVASHTETQEELVVHYSLDGIWAIPLELFNESVWHEGNSFPRFRFIGTDHSEVEAYLNIHPKPIPEEVNFSKEDLEKN